ncbi:AtpZ/AtpI family protein [Rhodohalobacter halophilus]|uniref:AtpZ/AtpI family protein n=1 Tax=Rhodohalobacter halophilus TaxID=1812810 RepID=UPI00083FBA10|nr:AtpZ/AtpI family protein [Rhodohalobacter halophilus]
MVEDPRFKKYLEYLSLGGEIAVSFSLPILIGYFMDVRFETSPWGVLGGVAVGMFLMIGMFIRLIKNVGEK